MEKQILRIFSIYRLYNRRNKKKSNRGTYSPSTVYMILLFCNSISLSPLSPLSSPARTTEEDSPKSQSNSRIKFVFLLITIIAVLYYVIPLSSNSEAQSHSSSFVMKEINSFLYLCGQKLYDVYYYILLILQVFLNILSKLDFHYYYLSYMEFYNRMPVIAITLLTILSIVLIVIVLFAVYAFCKFFLFISDSSTEEVKLDEDVSSSTHKRASVKEYFFKPLFSVE